MLARVILFLPLYLAIQVLFSFVNCNYLGDGTDIFCDTILHSGYADDIIF